MLVSNPGHKTSASGWRESCSPRETCNSSAGCWWNLWWSACLQENRGFILLWLIRRYGVNPPTHPQTSATCCPTAAQPSSRLPPAQRRPFSPWGSQKTDRKVTFCFSFWKSRKFMSDSLAAWYQISPVYSWLEWRHSSSGSSWSSCRPWRRLLGGDIVSPTVSSERQRRRRRAQTRRTTHTRHAPCFCVGGLFLGKDTYGTANRQSPHDLIQNTSPPPAAPAARGPVPNSSNHKTT